MAKVANSSVSQSIAPMDEHWMGCIAYQLNTIMKACITAWKSIDNLKEVDKSLTAAKGIVRIFKQSGWNSEIANGLHLIQEIETRCSTTFKVAQRFVQAAPSVLSIIREKNSRPARAFAANIFTVQDPASNLNGYPGLEAIAGACDMISYVQAELEPSERSTVHLALPMLQRCMDELWRIAGGGEVERGFYRGCVTPHTISRNMCA